MTLRRATCARKEQEVKEHTYETLKSLLRESRSQLKFIVYGQEVCKQVFTWAHGFAEGSFNRTYARFNKDFREAHPIEV